MALKRYISSNLGVINVLNSAAYANVNPSVRYPGYYYIQSLQETPVNIIINNSVYYRKPSMTLITQDGEFFVDKNELQFKSLMENGIWSQSRLHPGYWYLQSTDKDINTIEHLYQDGVEITQNLNFTSPATSYVIAPKESEFICLNCTANNEWVADDNESNVWYYVNIGNNAELNNPPVNVYVNNIKFTKVSSGTPLQAGQWKWEQDPTGNYYTIYIYDDSGQDIDDKPAGFVVAELGSESQTIYVAYSGSDLNLESVTYLFFDDETTTNTIYIKWSNDSILTKTIKTVSPKVVVPPLPSNNSFINISTIICNPSNNPQFVILKQIDNQENELVLFHDFVEVNETAIIDSKFVVSEGDRIVVNSTTGEGTILISGDIATIQ